MTFTSLNAATTELWRSLRSFVSESAVNEILVRPPAAEDDEASFLRLVAWAYVMTFEAGRVAIPYLLEISGYQFEKRPDPKQARNLIHALRTWSSHNLGFSSERDAEMSRRVQLWFIETCGQNPPTDANAWRSCFRVLCAEVETIVVHCQHAMTTVLSSPDDGEAATADLRRRIDRAWPAHKFHTHVGDAAIRLGITVDATKFSASRLAKWRRFLESLPDGDEPAMHMIRLIERDLLDHTADVLPIDGRDVMSNLGLSSGPDVGAALRFARELYQSGNRERGDLLKRLIDRYNSKSA